MSDDVKKADWDEFSAKIQQKLTERLRLLALEEALNAHNDAFEATLKDIELYEGRPLTTEERRRVRVVVLRTQLRAKRAEELLELLAAFVGGEVRLGQPGQAPTRTSKRWFDALQAEIEEQISAPLIPPPIRIALMPDPLEERVKNVENAVTALKLERDADREAALRSLDEDALNTRVLGEFRLLWRAAGRETAQRTSTPETPARDDSAPPAAQPGASSSEGPGAVR